MDMVSRWAMVTGFTRPRAVTKQPWHLIVLEDLGVSIPSMDAPRGGGGVSPSPADAVPARLNGDVDMTSEVKSWVKIFDVFIRVSPC